MESEIKEDRGYKGGDFETVDKEETFGQEDLDTVGQEALETVRQDDYAPPAPPRIIRLKNGPPSCYAVTRAQEQ